MKNPTMASAPQFEEPQPALLSRLHGERPSPESIKILTIDGGGVRGIIPAAVLGEIERATGRHPSELFDVIAGTSTGSLLAMSMVVPGEDGQPRYRAASLADAYEEFAPKVFPRDRWVQIRGLVHERYSADGLEGALKDYLGDARFADAMAQTIVPTYDLIRQDIHVFDSAESASVPKSELLMRHVVRGATAAPTFFDPFIIEPPISAQRSVLLDGGVYANNPSMLVLTQVARRYPGADVVLVSLGTGQEAVHASSSNGEDWGLAQWARPLLHIVSNSSNSVVDLELAHLLGPERYFRFQVELSNQCDLDDATPPTFRRLRTLAEELLANRGDDLAQICALLALSPRVSEMTNASNSALAAETAS